MARKPKRGSTDTTPTSGKPKPLPVVWRNYRIPEQDIPTVLEDAQNEAKLSSRIARLWTSGADFSVKYNPERGNWSAFTIEATSEDIPDRTGISAFGANQWQAVAALFFKVDVYLTRPDKFSAGNGGSVLG